MEAGTRPSAQARHWFIVMLLCSFVADSGKDLLAKDGNSLD
jgi:hypothetical protein